MPGSTLARRHYESEQIWFRMAEPGGVALAPFWARAVQLSSHEPRVATKYRRGAWRVAASEADACPVPALTRSRGGGVGTQGCGGPGQGPAALTSGVLDAPGQEGSPAGAALGKLRLTSGRGPSAHLNGEARGRRTRWRRATQRISAMNHVRRSRRGRHGPGHVLHAHW